MVLPDLDPGIWIGIAIGILGISFWVVGLVVFHFLLKRYRKKPPSVEDA